MLARHLIEEGAEWRGLHIFTGSQTLGANAIIEAQANVLLLAAELAEAIGGPLPKLNMGGGSAFPISPATRPSTCRKSARRWPNGSRTCRR